MFPTDPVVNDYRYCNWFLLCTRMYMYTQLWEIIATHWPLFTPERAFLPYFWKQGHSLFDPDLMSNGWNRTSPETLFQRLQCQEKKALGRSTGTWFEMFGRSGADSWLWQDPLLWYLNKVVRVHWRAITFAEHLKLEDGYLTERYLCIFPPRKIRHNCFPLPTCL